MRWTGNLRLRFRSLFNRERVDQELSREIDLHLDYQIEENLAAGMSPEEARRAALRTVGGIARIQEECRDARGLNLLDDLLKDFRYALRGHARNPGFTLVAVVTLALGIGANSAIFTVVHELLLEPPPYPNPDQLVRIVENVPPAESRTGEAARIPNMTPEDARELEARTQVISHVSISSEAAMTLTGRGEAAVVRVSQVSASTLPMLGVPPAIGRVFSTEEDNPGSGSVVILSHNAWRRYFGATPDVLGQSIALTPTFALPGPPAGVRTYTVIGVMPEGFEFPDPQTELWSPLALGPARPGQLRRVGTTMARLKDGVSLEAAAAEVNTIFAALRGVAPSSDAGSVPPRMEVVPVQDERARPFRQALLVLTGAVGLVLLIACINVANLLMSRTTTRQREMAIRVSLGAGRGRLVRQVLTESVMLALIGGAGGVLLAVGGTRLLVRQWPGNVPIPGRVLPALEGIGVDGAVFAFTLLISILTGLLFGLAPALRIVQSNHMQAMKDGAASNRSASTMFRWTRAGSSLVVAEVAMALILFMGAQLLIHSFLNLTSVDAGFDSNNVLTFVLVAPPGSRTQTEGLSEELLVRLKSLPGVRVAGRSQWSPLEPGSTSGPRFEIPGVPNGLLEGVQLRFLPVSRDYLETIGVRLVAGRWFNENDDSGQPPVMLINRELARHFPDGNPIGEFVNSGMPPVSVEVVGVVENVRQRGLDLESQPQYFFDFRQYSSGPLGGSFFAVRTEDDPLTLVPAIRVALSQLDGRAAVDNVATLEQLVSNTVAPSRFNASIVSIFACVAVVLAAIGIYGVTAYSVTQRTREIGIRMALGARRSEVLTMVLREGLILAAIGIVFGLAGAAATTRYLQGMLFGLTPLDPPTFLVVPLVFGAIALLACYLPARRATRVDPLIAFRCE